MENKVIFSGQFFKILKNFAMKIRAFLMGNFSKIFRKIDVFIEKNGEKCQFLLKMIKILIKIVKNCQKMSKFPRRQARKKFFDLKVKT